MKQAVFLALALASTLAGCGGSAAPAQPVTGFFEPGMPTPGRGGPTPTPTPSPTHTATATPSPTPSSAAPTSTPTASAACALPATGNLYVADTFANLVTVYPASSTGNVAPTRTIAINDPQAITVDASGNLYVYANSPVQIVEYAAGTSTIVRTIAGSATGLGSGYGIAVDGTGEIFVTNTSAGTISVFAAGASGNVAPTRTITPASFSPAWSVAVDSGGTAYATSGTIPNSMIAVFAPGASGAATPIRTISGSAANLGAIFIRLDPSANIYVSNTYGTTAPSSIAGFTNSASGNVAAFRTIVGAATGLNPAQGLTFDSSGNVYVVSTLQDEINVYAPGTNGNVAPCRSIQGTATMLTEPEDVVLGP
jgi:hypothetical protein